jgi:hypothetical protein
LGLEFFIRKIRKRESWSRRKESGVHKDC